MAKFLTYSSSLILRALAAGSPYGFEIMDVTGLPSGTVYPALRSLERKGFVRARWESEAVARSDSRPARKYYELTAAGDEELARVVERFPGLERALPDLSARSL